VSLFDCLLQRQAKCLGITHANNLNSVDVVKSARVGNNQGNTGGDCFKKELRTIFQVGRLYDSGKAIVGASDSPIHHGSPEVRTFEFRATPDQFHVETFKCFA